MDLDQARDLLDAPDAARHKEAVTFLIEQGSKPAADILKLYLNDSDKSISGMARDGLKQLCFPVQTEDRKINFDKFEELMRSPDPVYRTRVIMTARKFKQDELLPYYIGNLYEEEDEFVIATLIQAIGEAGDSAVIPTLSRFLKHESSRVRANTIEALARIGGDRIPALIEPLVEDTHHRVRICAVKALWDMGDRRVLEKLNWMIRSELPADRASAVFMFGLIDDPETIAPLMEAMTDDDESVRKKALRSLGFKINDASVKEMFLELMFSDQKNLSELAKEIMDSLQGRVLCLNCGLLNRSETKFCGRCGGEMKPENSTVFEIPSDEEIEERAAEYHKQKLKERALQQLASAQERGLKKRAWSKPGGTAPIDFDDGIDSI